MGEGILFGVKGVGGEEEEGEEGVTFGVSSKGGGEVEGVPEVTWISAFIVDVLF